MFDKQVSLTFFIILSLAFGVYGVRELAHAYRLSSFREWIEKAFLGTSGLMLGAVFARCGYWLVGGVEGLSAMAGWFRH